MTLETLVGVLGGRRCGSGWMAHCPAHEDRRPSLSIRAGRDGRILVKCWSGCSQNEVIAALRDRGLWPESRRWSPAEKRRRRALAPLVEACTQATADWHNGLALHRQSLMQAVSQALDNDGEKLAEELADLIRRTRFPDDSPATVARAYARNLKDDPEGTKCLRALGQEDREHAERVTAEVIRLLETAQRRDGDGRKEAA